MIRQLVEELSARPVIKKTVSCPLAVVGSVLQIPGGWGVYIPPNNFAPSPPIIWCSIPSNDLLPHPPPKFPTVISKIRSFKFLSSASRQHCLLY